MPRDEYTHNALEWFRLSVKSAALIAAKRRSAFSYQMVANSLRAFVAAFDVGDVWEDGEVRAEALRVADQLEALERGESPPAMAPADVEALEADVDRGIAATPLLPSTCPACSLPLHGGTTDADR